MDSLQPHRVQKAGGVAEDHPSIASDGRNRPPAAIGHRLRSVADHLAAVKQTRNHGVLFEILQYVLRIEPRIEIVKAGDEAERDDVIFTAINPGAAILFRRQRPAQRVDHFTRRDASRRYLPKFFHSNAVGLRIGVAGKIEFRDKLFC
jgi:hypothetical protein